MEFDYKKLAESNELLWQWSLYFKIHNNYFLEFAYKLADNKKLYLNKIINNEVKKKFLNDFETMFYAKTVENELIKQYIPMVHLCVRRFKIISADAKQDAFDIGLQALRGAIWRYRITKHKFLSYAMTGTILAIRGLVSLRLRQKKSNKLVQVFHDRETKSPSRCSKLLVDYKAAEPCDYVSGYQDLETTFSRLTENLSKDEKKLLEYKITNPNFREEFIKYYKSTHGKKMTKDSFITVWNKTKKKLWAALSSIKRPEELDSYKNPFKQKFGA